MLDRPIPYARLISPIRMGNHMRIWQSQRSEFHFIAQSFRQLLDRILSLASSRINMLFPSFGIPGIVVATSLIIAIDVWTRSPLVLCSESIPDVSLNGSLIQMKDSYAHMRETIGVNFHLFRSTSALCSSSSF